MDIKFKEIIINEEVKRCNNDYLKNTVIPRSSYILKCFNEKGNKMDKIKKDY